jgi:CDP-diacylglycerol--glycerol-3-phosphate 3-phosphatidyltransferase
MQADENATHPPRTLTDQMRVIFKDVLEPVARFLNRIGLQPNTLTLMGLAGNLVGALFLAMGNYLVGGLIVVVMGPIDALDGTMARLRGEPTDFGAFVDSVTDRYIELIIYGGLLVHFLLGRDLVAAGIVFAAAGGSVLVSYVRARAESLGFSVKRGILTRVERYLVLAPALVLGFPRIGLLIIAVFANVTALQRILIVRGQARKRS